MDRLTDKERELYEHLTGAQQRVYLHLRDKRFYFKTQEFYGKQELMAEFLNINVKTIKRAIKRLQEIGLLNVSKKWKMNYYSLPCYDNLTPKAEEKPDRMAVPSENRTESPKETINIEDLEVSDNPDTDFSDLLFKVKMDGVIDSQISALRGIPECTRWQEQQRVVNMVASHFGVRNNDAQKVVEQIVCGAF